MGQAICKANASELGAMGAKKRWEAFRAEKIAAETARLLPATEATIDRFTQDRLLRVRKQLEKIDRMLEEELDPAKIDRLASAASRLEEQERRLSNRSLPPTLKAGTVKTKRSSGSAPEPESA